MLDLETPIWKLPPDLGTEIWTLGPGCGTTDLGTSVPRWETGAGGLEIAANFAAQLS